jgi:uncharacterized protein (TIGR02284 family)
MAKLRWNHKTGSIFSIEYSSMNPKSPADIVNDLRQVLNAGKEGFRKAASAARDPELKALFSQFASEREEMAEDLRQSMPAEPKEKKSAVEAAVHRGLIDMKTALTSGDDYTILAECERGENRAVEMFKKALDQDLPSDLCRRIKSQSMRILEAHDRVKELRDTAQPIL